MKIINKIKFIILVILLLLSLCGVFFLGEFFYKDHKECITQATFEAQKQENQTVLDELTSCQADLFTTKNELERAKILPDTRKDIINLLLIMRDMEKNIGKKNNFSNDCVRFFALASRIPIVQEYVLKYKTQLFENNCQFYSNKELVAMLLPFRVNLLKEEREQRNQTEKIYIRVWNGIKYHISKLFIESKIQKSEIETLVDDNKYHEALTILMSYNITKNDDFNTLYSAIHTLQNLKAMIDGTYEILVSNN